MKNWKKYLALLTALMLVLSFVACGAANEEPSEPAAEQTDAPVNENPTEAPTEEVEAPTAEATEEVTEPSADYSAYMGLWYTGNVTLKIEEGNKWSMEDNGELFTTGKIVVNEEDGTLQLYDVEGTEAAKLIKDTADSLYAELYTEEMYTRIEDFFFSRVQSEGGIDAPIDEVVSDDPVIEDDSDETVNEG